MTFEEWLARRDGRKNKEGPTTVMAYAEKSDLDLNWGGCVRESKARV